MVLDSPPQEEEKLQTSRYFQYLRKRPCGRRRLALKYNKQSDLLYS